MKDDNEVLVVVHNPSGKSRHWAEIQTAYSSYAVQIWCPHSQKFYDISKNVTYLRKIHRANDGTQSTDYKLGIPFAYPLEPNQVYYIKLVQMCGSSSVCDWKPTTDEEDTKPSRAATLEFIKSEKAPLKFKFQKNYYSEKGDIEETLEQAFSVNVGYYRADNGSDGYGDGHSNDASGAYLFKPQKEYRYLLQYGSTTVKMIDQQYSKASET